MVIIVSEGTDGTTTQVMQWMKGMGYMNKVIRINTNDLVYLNEINLSEDRVIIESDGKKIDLSKDVSVIWFRRGTIPLSLRRKGEKRKKLKLFDSPELNGHVRSHLLEESLHLIEAVNNPNTKLIGGYGKGVVNKINVLNAAKRIGIEIPITVILDSREPLQEFFNQQNGSIITKGISDTLSFETDRMGYIVYTNKITQEKIDELPDHFFPSLFQGNIDKKIELRVFFWFGKIYSLAIFSQLDEQTNTDFRIYNKEKPNRMIPYQLPEELCDKINQLMNEIGLETGSLDFILDTNDKFVFLEVNPVGQFGMVSSPGNYMIEKHIAETLIKFENEFQAN